MIFKLPTSLISSFVLAITLAVSVSAQPKRQTPARTQPPAPTPAPTPPPPTFDTLIAADTYRVYGEVRSVGQLIKSPSFNEILEPILKLAGPPKEFRTFVKWLNLHADEVMSSRMLVATWAASRELPEAVIAIEFASPEEAAKFQQQLTGLLQKVIPPPAGAGATPEPNKPATADPPPYHMQQVGSLVVITPKASNLAKLRPAGTKLLTEDVNFRVARNRLNTDSVFIFFDVGALEREEAEREKKAEQEFQKAAADKAANPQAAPKVELHTDPDDLEAPPPGTVPPPVEIQPGEAGEQVVETGVRPGPQPDQKQSVEQLLMDLSMTMVFMGAEGKWPAAIGFAISLESDSFDVRALMVNAPGEKTDPIPFLPLLATGPPIVPEGPNILPADTEMLFAMSVDLPQVYELVSKPRPMLQRGPPDVRVENAGTLESPFAAVERQLKINIKDDLLPLIGSEIVVTAPMTGFDFLQPPKPPPAPSTSPSPSPSPSASPNDNAGDNFTITETVVGPPSMAVLISLRDREGMRTFLPKLIDSLGFKGASALAQTERREDTEFVSYANMFAYAFIGNFLVISPDVKLTRHIVDSYLKKQTLSGEAHFKNYTRWQPRQVQGQIYISPSLMESYRKWINEPKTPVDEQTRAFLTRFSIVAQSVTYALSNEGFGPMHELHVPKNLVLLLIAASAGSWNSPAAPPEPSPPVAKPPVLPANPF